MFIENSKMYRLQHIQQPAATNLFRIIYTIIIECRSILTIGYELACPPLSTYSCRSGRNGKPEDVFFGKKGKKEEKKAVQPGDRRFGIRLFQTK